MALRLCGSRFRHPLAARRRRGEHVWTNGFVEHRQGTILHDRWRVELRRRYSTRLAQLQRSLDSFIRFHNHERSHPRDPSGD